MQGWGRRQSQSCPCSPGLAPACPRHGGSEEEGLLLPRQQTVRGGRHGLDVYLGREAEIRDPSLGWRVLLHSSEPSGSTGAQLTSLTASVRIWMIFSCGVATTLCPLISMMRCPTRMPPRSAMPPRIRLQIWEQGMLSELVTTALNPHSPVGSWPELLPGVHTSSSPWACSEGRDVPVHCCQQSDVLSWGQGSPQDFVPWLTRLWLPHSLNAPAPLRAAETELSGASGRDPHLQS